MADKNDNDEQLGEAGIRALRAEREDNKNLRSENATLKQQLAEAEQQRDANLTRATTAEGRVKELETEKEIDGIKAEVSKTTGVPLTLLKGATKEEIEAHAEELKPFVTNGPRPPKPDHTQGQNLDGAATTDKDTEALSILGFGD